MTDFPRPISASDIRDRFSSGMLSDQIAWQGWVLAHFGRWPFSGLFLEFY